MNFAKKLLAPLAVTAAVLLASVALTFIATPPPAKAALAPAGVSAAPYGYWDLWTNTITTGASITNSAHPAMDINPGMVLVIFPTVVTTNASTSNVVFSFRTSLDGANWSSGFTYSGSIPLNGTTTNQTPVIIGTNLIGRFIAFDKVDAATALQTVTLVGDKLPFAWLPAVGR